jgi:hypothetical protein
MHLALITPHDAFQDGVLLFIVIAVVFNSAFLARHLYDHRRWRESEDAEHRRTGALH